MTTLDHAMKRVRDEVKRIRVEEPDLPTPYIVVELGTRLNDIKKWEQYDENLPRLANIRKLCELCISERGKRVRDESQIDLDMEDPFGNFVDWANVREATTFIKTSGLHPVRVQKFLRQLVA